MFNKAERNNEVRQKMKQFKKDNFNPSAVVLAERINMNYTMFVNWTNHKRDLGSDSLKKIEKFINQNTK